MGKIISVANQKGGVGKTTTTVNLSAAIGSSGKRVLVVDIDPQGNATSGLGVNKRSIENSTYNLMITGARFEETVLKTTYKNIDILPSNIHLAGAEIDLVDMDQRTFRLKQSLAAVRSKYDFVFIDCPPSLGLITLNAFTASDTILVPIQCEYYAMEGLSQGDPELFPLQVFTSVLGGGMSSRLFQEVRELRGLCYSIYAFHAPYADTGMFGLYAGTDAIDAPELMRVVVDEIVTAADTVTEAEIARAKAQMKAGMLMALESSGARAEQLARQIIVHGRPVPMDEIVAKIDAVTVESTREAGRALITRSRPAVAALGPSGLDSAAAIADRLTQKAA